jgi:hypothetical protein
MYHLLGDLNPSLFLSIIRTWCGQDFSDLTKRFRYRTVNENPSYGPDLLETIVLRYKCFV